MANKKEVDGKIHSRQNPDNYRFQAQFLTVLHNIHSSLGFFNFPPFSITAAANARSQSFKSWMSS